MASDTDSHKLIEISQEIKICFDVNDLGGSFECYACIVFERNCGYQRLFIHVDHLIGRIMLVKLKRFNSDIVAVLKGNTETLEQVVIQSCDRTIIGRFNHNTVVVDATNRDILEFVLLPGKDADDAIIGDPRTRDVFAKLLTSDPSDPTELTTISYNPLMRLNAVTKILILLLAFKMSKNKPCPRLKFPPINYFGLDELANIETVTIFKSLHKKADGNKQYTYFDVISSPSFPKLLTVMVFTDGSDGCRLEVLSPKNDRRLFSAAPLLKFSHNTKLYMSETIEIGETENYKLRAKSLIAKYTYNAELIADGIPIPNSSQKYFKIHRWSTHQTIATITPNFSATPREVIVWIHRGVDTLHRALILTFAMKLIYNFYGFYQDDMSRKRHLLQTLTDHAGSKKAAYSSTERPIAYSSASYTRSDQGPSNIQSAYSMYHAHVGESTFTAADYEYQRREPPPPGTSPTSTRESSKEMVAASNVMTTADPSDQDSD